MFRDSLTGMRGLGIKLGMKAMSAMGVTLAISVLAGCASLGEEAGSAADTAAEFYTDLASGNPAGACELLLPAVRADLEDEEGRPCEQALPEMNLPSVTPNTRAEGSLVDVYGGVARVMLDGDTVFLTEVDGRWRVHGAACQQRPDRPYKCQIKAG